MKREKLEQLEKVAKEILEQYQAIGYQGLKEKINTVESSSEGDPGDDDFYQVEVNIFHDNFKDGDIRVMVSVDRGTIRSPVNDSFIITPEGEFL